MDENRRTISSSAPYSRPTISIPATSTVENLFAVGGSGAGATPGPMTLISNFFSENSGESDYRTFSQILAGAVSSPAQGSGGIRSRDPDNGGSYSDDLGGGVDFQFSNAGRPSRLFVTQASKFTIPPGLSPATLLDSPGNFPPVQGSIGLSHHHVPPRIPDHNAINQAPEPSNSGSHSQPPTADKPADDGYNWRKYGQKQMKGSEFPRSYYRCTHKNCPVTKKVERSLDGLVTEIIYKGKHNHQPPRSIGASGESESFKEQTHTCHVSNEESLLMNDHESAHEILGSSDSDDDASIGITKPQAKKRNIEVSSHHTLTKPRIIIQATSEIDLLDDGYKWRKYGQKVVKGRSHPRSYYKCTGKGCNVRKHVERAASDPKAVVTTYEGKHNHLAATTKNVTNNTTKETISQLQSRDPVALLRLKDEYIT